MSIFINRKQEIEFLDKKHKSNSAELLVFYGRRRVGKTELISKFCENKNHLYFMGRLESREDTLKRMNNLLIEKFNDSYLLNNPFRDLDSIFDYLNEKSTERIIFVVDEFPFLVHKFPEIVSILQDKWDSKLKNSKIMLVLLGSSISMMEKYAIDYKSPLYGRRTGQWKVKKMNVKYLKEFFPKYSTEDLIRVFSCVDTIPGYLNLLDKNDSFLNNLESKFFSKGEFFYEEVEILMREELRDPSNYMSIISAIAGGLTNFNEIHQKSGLDKSMLSKYLSVLNSLNIVGKTNSITGSYKSKLKSKKALYFINDNFFDFWFRFIYLNKSKIEEGKKDIFKNIKKDFEKYVSFKFERYCEEFLKNVLQEFDDIGRWWHKDKEIDLVALNEDKKEILFGECKWKKKVNAEKIVKKLCEKSKHVKWNNEKRKESFAVFAKSFSKKIKEFEGKKVYCYDLKDIGRL